MKLDQDQKQIDLDSRFQLEFKGVFVLTILFCICNLSLFISFEHKLVQFIFSVDALSLLNVYFACVILYCFKMFDYIKKCNSHLFINLKIKKMNSNRAATTLFVLIISILVNSIGNQIVFLNGKYHLYELETERVNIN